MLTKLHCKNEHFWRSSIYNYMYRFLVGDTNNNLSTTGHVGAGEAPFEEEREITVPQGLFNNAFLASYFVKMQQQRSQSQLKFENMYFVGLQKTREVRNLLKALKAKNYSIRQFMTGSNDQQQVLLPFFTCLEASDKSSIQTEVENELVVAMRALYEPHNQFFGPEAKFIFGLTCAGSIVCAYVFKRVSLLLL